MENISLDDRIRVITEYEIQTQIEKIKNRMLNNPLCRARRYIKRVAYYSISEREKILDAIKKQICQKYNVRKVTELDWTLYDEVNDYAILLWDLKMAEDEFVYAYDIRELGHGKDRHRVSWETWKAFWKEWANE